MMYLNDVEEGGETEFLYLAKRFKPIKGRMLGSSQVDLLTPIEVIPRSVEINMLQLVG